MKMSTGKESENERQRQCLLLLLHQFQDIDARCQGYAVALKYVENKT